MTTCSCHSRQRSAVAGGASTAAGDASIVLNICKLFERGGFYFSRGGRYDLTSTMQVQCARPPTDRPLGDGAYDKRFLFNAHLLRDLITAATEPLLLPLIQGSVGIQSVVLDERVFELALISRKSRFRAGLRYLRRGIDKEGHVANFVETEQVRLSFRRRPPPSLLQIAPLANALFTILL